jgi:hypothetical protein
MTEQTVPRVDQNGLKTGQALTILLLAVAFVLDVWWLVAFVAVAQLLGALDVPFAPYRLFYKHALLPTGMIKPDPQPDNPEPHRFAMLLGAIFNTIATVGLLAEAGWIAWAPVGIVFALANLNFWLNFCMGCWMYYQLSRRGVPGFTQAPVHD